MSEKLQAVLYGGLPAIRLSELRGDPYKGKLDEHIEYHTMAPADAKSLARELFRLATKNSANSGTSS